MGLNSLADRPSCGGGGSALSSHLHVPIDRACHGSDLGLPGPPCGSGSSWNSLHSTHFPLGSNALGLAVVASTALLAGLTLVMPFVETGVVFVSSDTPPGLCTLSGMPLMGSVPTFLAMWTGPRPTHPASSGGSSHKQGNFKTSRQGSTACCTEAVPSPRCIAACAGVERRRNRKRVRGKSCKLYLM